MEFTRTKIKVATAGVMATSVLGLYLFGPGVITVGAAALGFAVHMMAWLQRDADEF